MDRRKFLALSGGGVILAASTATAGFTLTRTPHRALQPWKDAGSLYSDPRKKALSYAILAPNPHNRQPWIVDLSKPGQVILHVDTDRLLPHTDPFSRQITIGLGCFLELMRMAAAKDGYKVDLILFPEGEDDAALDKRPVAVATFLKDETVASDPLWAHVLSRRSLKEPYDVDRAVPRDALAKLEAASSNGSLVGTSNESAMVSKLRRLTRKAMVIEVETPRTFKESVDLFRIGKAEIESNPDGIDFSGPMFEAMSLTGVFTREAAMDKTTAAYREGLKSVTITCETAMAHVWLISRTNTRVDQINAGRDWLRINLTATGEGLGTQPMSQPLQEYDEMKPCYDEIHKMLAPEGGTIQMLGRLGYGVAVPPSPRWPLDAKILKA